MIIRVSLRFGRPPTQSDDDMSIDLPTDTPIGNASIIPSMYQRVEFDAFRAHCQLATIKGQVYKDLYSAAAKDRSLSELITSVGALDQMLENWKEELPSKYQPESQRLQSISMTLLYLHCSYFNCIIAMHRLIASRGIRTGDDLVRKYQNFSFSASLSGSRRVFSSESLCTNAARASIRLMKYIPEGHISAVGYVSIQIPWILLSVIILKFGCKNPHPLSHCCFVNSFLQHYPESCWCLAIIWHGAHRPGRDALVFARCKYSESSHRTAEDILCKLSRCCKSCNSKDHAILCQ